MNYLTLVLCHDEVHYVKLFQSKLEAETKAIELANEWYLENGANEFTQKPIKTINEMNEYYQSKPYLDSGESSHVLIEEVEL